MQRPEIWIRSHNTSPSTSWFVCSFVLAAENDSYMTTAEKVLEVKLGKHCTGICKISFYSDSVKRHLRGRHLSVLNLKFDFISDGGCTREEQIALSLKRHLFPHGGREPQAFWICFSRVQEPSEIKSNFKFKTLKRHLLKRHLTLSDLHDEVYRISA